MDPKRLDRLENQVAALRHALMAVVAIVGKIIARKYPTEAEALRRIWESLRTLSAPRQ